jgi:hypothetical protein
MLGKGASDAEHLCYVREIDTFSRNRANHAVNLAKQRGIFQRAYRRKIESADFTDEIMEKVVALVGLAVSSRRITASHGLAQNQIAVAFVVRDNGREVQKAQPLEKIVSAARDFTLRQGAHTKHSNVAVAFGNGFKLGKSYAGSPDDNFGGGQISALVHASGLGNNQSRESGYQMHVIEHQHRQSRVTRKKKSAVRLRRPLTDAQSAKDKEEESSLTLENGLPASPKAIIIDHRIRDPHNLWWMAQSVD